MIFKHNKNMKNLFLLFFELHLHSLFFYNIFNKYFIGTKLIHILRNKNKNILTN